jgi:hypothetical protein
MLEGGKLRFAIRSGAVVDQLRSITRSCDSRPVAIPAPAPAPGLHYRQCLLAGLKRGHGSCGWVVSTPRAGAETRIALNRCTTDPRSARYTHAGRTGRHLVKRPPDPSPQSKQIPHFDSARMRLSCAFPSAITRDHRLCCEFSSSQ